MTSRARSSILSRTLASWGGLVARYPYRVMVAALVASVTLASQVTGLRFDTSFESFLSPEHPTRVTLEHFRDDFGRSEPIVVAVRIPDGELTPAFLEGFAALHRDLEARVPNLKRIRSLVNVRSTEARGDDLHVGELLEEWPADAAEFAAFEARLRATPLYRNYLIGELDDEGAGPLHWTSLLLEAERFESTPAFGEEAEAASLALASGDSGGELRKLTSDDDAAMVAVVRGVIAEHRAAGFAEIDIELAGSLVVGEVVSRAIKSDFAKLLGLAILVIGALLYVALRAWAAVASVLFVVLLALVACLGTMAALGAPFGFGTQILPTFLLAAGVGYAVHIVALFRHELEEQGERGAAVRTTLEHSGPPVILTALTTIGGLLSFTATDLEPIVQIGTFAPVGVALTLGLSLSLLPALLAVIPARFTARRSGATSPSLAVRVLVGAGDWAMAQREFVLLGLAAVLCASVFGMTRLETSHDTLRWLPSHEPVRTATELVDEELGGASVLELLIEAEEGFDLRTPELLARIDGLAANLTALDGGEVEIGKVAGIHDVVKELNQALHGDRSEHYAIPGDADLVSQELLLFEMSGMDDVEQLVDRSFTQTRLSVRVNRTDAFVTVPFSERVLEVARSELEGYARVELTGLYDLKGAVLVNVIGALQTSYTIAIVVVGLLMIVLTGDLRIGLVSLVPNMTPLVVALGVMGLCGIPIGVYTLLVGSIALGLAVDDTIHIAHSFVRYERETGDPVEAVRRALSTAGVAILFTSAALVCGFSIFGFATLSSLLHFGIVAAVAIAAALLADVFVSPVLFSAVTRGRERTRPGAPGLPAIGRGVPAA